MHRPPDPTPQATGPVVPSDRLATVIHDGLRFRDLDHDGTVAPYEDWRRPPAERATDLLGRLTRAEKVGLLLHGSAPSADGGPLASIGAGTTYDPAGLATLIVGRGVGSLITRLGADPARLADQNNLLQDIAAGGRLGIPVTVSSDPRHHLGAVLGAQVEADGFSLWPGPLGLAALGERAIVHRFGDVVRREYRAVGIHMALGPQADLATEPRWPRIDGTFGSDPQLVSDLVAAFVAGVQGGFHGLTPTGVAAVVKHWVGYGAARDGFDGHNWYGRFSAFPDNSFNHHVAAFLGAFEVGVAGVMPTYNILEGVTIDGEPLEPVGAGFNRQLLDGLLRTTHRYPGLILSDWAITADCGPACRTGVPPQTAAEIAMPWGVEDLTVRDRVAKGVNAGLDQFGGADDPTPLLAALEAGLVSESRLDASVLRVLTLKFQLGLFEDPFVDPDEAARVVNCTTFRHDGEQAQSRSVVRVSDHLQVALGSGDRIHLDGLEADAFTAVGLTVSPTPEEATVAVIRLSAPYELLHPGHFFGSRQHEGSLEFQPDDPAYTRFVALAARLPTIAVVDLDRPAVLTGVEEQAVAVFVVFGVSDRAVAEVLAGQQPALGRLPFDLPASMASVLAPGLEPPLHPRGHLVWPDRRRS